MKYSASKNRYSNMLYRTCGDSGVKLPLISLGLWHNFGAKTPLSNIKKILFYAFDRGITHFDLANNYGPPYGSTEINFGKIISKDLKKYRDELIISSKAVMICGKDHMENGDQKNILLQVVIKV